MGIASDIVSQFIDPIDRFVALSATTMARELNGPLRLGAILYIAIFGLLIVFGYVRAPLQDFAWNMLRIVAIVMLVTQAGNYNFFVKDLFFSQLPNGISAAIGKLESKNVNMPEVSNGAAFDVVLNETMAVADDIRQQGSWRNIYPIIVATVFTVAALIVSMVLLALVLYAKVALGLILSVGPIFICFVLFRATQPLFSSWLSAVINFVFLQVLIVAAITLILGIINNFVHDASGKDLGTQIVLAWRMLGLLALSAYLALQLPEIAARISSGGLALGGGIANSAVKALSKAVLSAPAFKPGSGSGGSISKG